MPTIPLPDQSPRGEPPVGSLALPGIGRPEAHATTAAPFAAATHPAWLRGPILVAIDRTPLAAFAARVAGAVADRVHAPVQLVHVLDARGAPLPPPLDLVAGLSDADAATAVEDTLAQDLRAQLRGAGSETPPAVVDWPVRIGVGIPAEVLVAEAAAAGAGLLVLGLRRHGPLGRVFEDETVLEVLRRVACPVLAVAPELRTLPRCVVVGIDFSRTSAGAARIAAALLAPEGRLVLAYVPRGLPLAPDDGESVVHALGVQAAFAALRAELPPALSVEQVVLEREGRGPAERLLGLAQEIGADLVATGGRRYGRVERWMLGSVTTDLARDGRCSLLVVPPAEPDVAGPGHHAPVDLARGG